MDGYITMSKQELTRLELIQKVIEKRLKQHQAAEQLNLTDRQIRRLCKAYKQIGPQGIVSKRRGKPGNRRMDLSLKQQVIDLVMEHYRDFGPTLAAEKLKEKHEICVSVETVRKLMMEAQIWTTRDNKLKRSYQPRYRRAATGELVQIDGSDHDWFDVIVN